MHSLFKAVLARLQSVAAGQNPLDEHKGVAGNLLYLDDDLLYCSEHRVCDVFELLPASLQAVTPNNRDASSAPCIRVSGFPSY